MKTRTLLFASMVTVVAACGGDPKGAQQPSGAASSPAGHLLAFSLDSDEDGVPDAIDECPDAKEDGYSLFALSFDGCPKDRPDARKREPTPPPSPPPPPPPPPAKKKVEVKDDQIVINEEILFETGSAKIDQASDALLRTISDAIKGHADIDFIEIAGHADKRGTQQSNRALTQQRSDAVEARLVANGIDVKRLRAVGYGSLCPLAEGDDEAAYAKNRRVEFRILRRGGKDLAVRWGGCAAAEKAGMKPMPLPPATKGGATTPPAAPPVDPCAAALAKHTAEKEACDGGDAKSCLALGKKLAAEPGSDASCRAAPLSKACDGAETGACVLLAGDLLAGHGGPADAERGLALLTQACGKGEGRACHDAGRRYADVLHQEAAALPLLQKACIEARGGEDDCELLLKYGAEKLGVPTFARVALTRCEYGRIDSSGDKDAASCAALKAALDRSAVPADLLDEAYAYVGERCAYVEKNESSCALFKQVRASMRVASKGGSGCDGQDVGACTSACSAGDGASCASAAVAYAYGKGVPRDLDRAHDVAALGCRAGDAVACNFKGLFDAGAARRVGKIPNPIPAQTASLDEACEGGVTSACSLNIGEVLWKTQTDYTFVGAKQFARLPGLCDRGDALACFVAAQEFEARSVPDAQAITLLQKACDAGLAVACSNLGYVLGGRSKFLNVAAAKDAYARACTMHFKPACVTIAEWQTTRK